MSSPLPEPGDGLDSSQPAGPTVRLRLDLAYDGTAFAGWATQPGQRTVQDELETGLATILRVERARLVVAGRTDAGVHAAAQVAHLDIDEAAFSGVRASLLTRLAGVLGPDVRVYSVRPVSPDFDARFSAIWRRYRYRISDADYGVAPLQRFDTAVWRSPLDHDLMAAAAEQLVGLHDFVAFCRRREHASTIRHLQLLQVNRDGDQVLIQARADAFCHSMVRSLVGAIAAVGAGRQPLSWIAGLLSRAVRADDVTVAPARGLTLAEVGYPPDSALAARARESRTLRTPVALTGATLPTAGAPALATSPSPEATEPPVRLLDLSVLITTGMPVYPGDPEVVVTPALTIAEHWVNVAGLHLGSQSGTHIDAPNHVSPTGSPLSELPLERFVGPAVVADLRHLGAGTAITAAMLQPVLDQLRPGRLLLLCTGWSQYWGTERYLDHPWLDPAATELVLRAGIRTLGIDAWSMDASPASDDSFPSHRLIAAVDGVIIENLTNLEGLLAPQLSGRNIEVTVLPLRLDTVDGSPVRAVARIRP